MKRWKYVLGLFLGALAALSAGGCRTEAEVASSVWRIEPHAVVVQHEVLGTNRTDLTVVMTDGPLDCATARSLVERSDARPPDGIQFLLTFYPSPWSPGGKARESSVSRYDGRGALVTSSISYLPSEDATRRSWLSADVLEAPRRKGEVARIRVSGSAAFRPMPEGEGDAFRLTLVDEDEAPPKEPFEVLGDVPATLCTDIVVP